MSHNYELSIGDACNLSTAGTDNAVNSDTLDKLFKEQLQTLRHLILKQCELDDMELCRKWLKVLGMTSKQEKLARNCLSSLMMNQLRERGHLARPFTNLYNCNRDLEVVLAEIDDNSSGGSNANEFTEPVLTGHRQQEMMQPKFDQRQFEANFDTLTECQENETKAQNVMLRQELDMVRLQLNEKRIENVRLKEIAERYQLENSKFSETFGSFKSMLLEAIGTALTRIENAKLKFPFNIFASVFGDFDTAPEFLKAIEGFDIRFQELLNKTFESQLNERKRTIARHVYHKLAKIRAKQREKYHRRLRMQKFSHRLQLKLVKLKCFSVLRQIFINSQHAADEGMWTLLKVLEEKYQTVVNEIV